MQNSKKNQLFKELEPFDWENRRNVVYYNNREVPSFYTPTITQKKNLLKQYSEEFKIEFHENILLPDSEKYINSTKYQFTGRLNQLNLLDNQLNDFKNPVNINADELLKYQKKLRIINFPFLEKLIDVQIKICSEIIDYIKKSNRITTSPQANGNQIAHAVELINAENDEKNLTFNQTNCSKHKAIFKGSKIDLIILVLTLHFGGIFAFEDRDHLVNFIEQNFKTTKVGKEKDITGVTNEISEIFRCLKENDKESMKNWDDKQFKLFKRINASVDNISVDFRNLPEDVTIPPKDSAGRW